MVSVEKKRMGRPTDEPKTIVKRARVSQNDVDKLRICCDALKKTESEVIRLGIDAVYQQLQQKK